MTVWPPIDDAIREELEAYVARPRKKAARLPISDPVTRVSKKATVCKAKSEGAGEVAIRAFLGGAFSKGHGVGDAPAVHNNILADQ